MQAAVGCLVDPQRFGLGRKSVTVSTVAPTLERLYLPTVRSQVDWKPLATVETGATVLERYTKGHSNLMASRQLLCGSIDLLPPLL